MRGLPGSVYDFEAANKYKRELDDTTFGSPEKAREWFYEKVYARPTQACSAASINALFRPHDRYHLDEAFRVLVNLYKVCPPLDLAERLLANADLLRTAT